MGYEKSEVHFYIVVVKWLSLGLGTNLEGGLVDLIREVAVGIQEGVGGAGGSAVMGSKNKCMFGHMAWHCVQPGSEFRHGAVRHQFHLFEFRSVQFHQDQDITRRSPNILGLWVSFIRVFPWSLKGPFTSCLKDVRPSTAMRVGWQFTRSAFILEIWK